MAVSTDETFGVFSEVTTTEADSGYRSVVLYMSRGDSIYGRSASVYWNLTLEEAITLGVALIERAERCRA